MGGELPRLKTGMGDVAAPASRYADLGKELWSLFEQGDLNVWRGLRAGDSGKETSRPTACHHHTSGTHAENRTKGQRESLSVKVIPLPRNWVAKDLLERPASGIQQSTVNRSTTGRATPN